MCANNTPYLRIPAAPALKVNAKSEDEGTSMALEQKLKIVTENLQEARATLTEIRDECVKLEGDKQSISELRTRIAHFESTSLGAEQELEKTVAKNRALKRQVRGLTRWAGSCNPLLMSELQYDFDF